MKLKITDVEKAFGIRIKRDFQALGVDTASRTGWCIAKTDKKHISLNVSFVDTGGSKDPDFRYKRLIETFSHLINDYIKPKEDCVVIEDTFMHMKFMNPKSFSLISRIGMIVYVLAELKGVENKYFILASQARMKLKLKGTAKKEEIHKELLKRLKLKLDDIDILDAIILAIGGLVADQIQGTVV